MSGLVGRVTNSTSLNEIIGRMSKAITYVSTDKVDRWSHGDFSIVRVHHGIINQVPEPIFNEEGNLCITMDGEVFDYALHKKTLDERGYRFKTKSDAEFCLHLYEENGLEAFKELNGSFLIVLYNLYSHELLLVNDRFSSRPLFYFHDGGDLLFGSQLRPLLEVQSLPRRLDHQAIFEFFTFQRVLGDRTFYQDVKVLPPASILRFRDGNLSIHQYWKMKYTDESHSEDYYVEALTDALRKAVARKTCGDYRFGLLLSGGLDSRTVLAADGAGKVSMAITLGDFENREVEIARKIAIAKGCNFIFLQRDIDHYYHLVDEAVDMGDGMYRFDHAHFLGFLKEINNECDIILHGHGLDYTFQGLYLPYAQIRVFGKTLELPSLARLDVNALSDVLLDKLSYSTNKFDVNQLLHPVLREQYIGSVKEAVLLLLRDSNVHHNNPYNAWDYFVLHSLSKHFTFLNFLCVRNYIDERTVIYDNDLFDCYLAMPPLMRAKGRVFRKAIRRLSKELATIPNSNTGLRADMPVRIEWVLKNSRAVLQKIGILPQLQLPNPAYTNGSWPNMSELIRHNIKLRNFIQQTLHDPECLSPELFDIEAVDSIFKQHINREKDSTSLLFLLLTFGRWHKKYGPK